MERFSGNKHSLSARKQRLSVGRCEQVRSGEGLGGVSKEIGRFPRVVAIPFIDRASGTDDAGAQRVGDLLLARIVEHTEEVGDLLEFPRRSCGKFPPVKRIASRSFAEG